MKKLLIWFGVIASFIILGLYLIKASHVDRNQSGKIKQEFAKDSVFQKDDLTDIPLLLFPKDSLKNDVFVILFPGDGGWRDFIDVVGRKIQSRGTPVVGFNTIPYFNEEKKPEQVAKDIQRVMYNFEHIWHRHKVILAGYSFSAELMTFVYNKIDKKYQDQIVSLVLIAPSNMADFIVNPVYEYDAGRSHNVLPEIEKILGGKATIICDKYKRALCRKIPDSLANQYKLDQLDVDHDFNGNYDSSSNVIVQKMGL